VEGGGRVWAVFVACVALYKQGATCASAPPGAGVVGTGTVNGISELREASQGGGLAGSIGGAVVGGMVQEFAH
jgi:hypothetical protein